ncbi:MAG: potassium transporter TrkG [Desulfotomaculaceae bacterium]|nr:potassium transporter TrkG [Desulfotomaculaceae bacterium]MDD4767157.1 potassium transporter TrkG [Desulfotomaculaceae bacterium]
MEKQGLYLKELKRKKLTVTPFQLIVLGYLLFAILGTVLISLPFSLQPGVKFSLIDALFTATSAISVTGLTVVDTKDTFSTTGKFILAFLMQFGGIGIMTLGTLVFVMRGNQISLRERMMISADQNQLSLQGMVYLMLFIFKATVLFELLGALILTLHFMSNYQTPFLNALGPGLFHSISGFTNSGFELFGNSLQNFQSDYVVKSVIGLLLLAGSIGFPVLLEVSANISSWRRQRRFKFSLYTKITTITFFALLLAGFIFVLLFEQNGTLAGMPWYQKISVSFFQSLTTRSGGFSLADIQAYDHSTLLFLCLLMFIGASPSSCGGGIRTTTFAVLILSLLSFLKGKSSVKVFRRELFQEDITKAFMVFFIAVTLVAAAVIALSAIENIPTTEILFEICSAFGTTGLSMGITANLSNAGKTVLIILMFIGRIGLVPLLFLFRGRKPEDRYHYVKEHIIVG